MDLNEHKSLIQQMFAPSKFLNEAILCSQRHQNESNEISIKRAFSENWHQIPQMAVANKQAN